VYSFGLCDIRKKLTYHESKFETRNFDAFPCLPSETFGEIIDTIELKWTRVNGPSLSLFLSHYFPSLKALYLDNITLDGNLEPVPLTSLQEFVLNEGLQPDDRQEAPPYSLGITEDDHLWLNSTLLFFF